MLRDFTWIEYGWVLERRATEDSWGQVPQLGICAEYLRNRKKTDVTRK